jgi:hypothetical protein
MYSPQAGAPALPSASSDEIDDCQNRVIGRKGFCNFGNTGDSAISVSSLLRVSKRKPGRNKILRKIVKAVTLVML